MSIYLMARIWKECAFTRAQQHIALSLADHADDDGTNIFPSVEYTAWKTGYDQRQVQRIVGELQGMGVLVMVRPPGARRPADYRMDLSKAPAKAPFKKGVKMSPKAVPEEPPEETPQVGGPAEMSPESSEELKHQNHQEESSPPQEDSSIREESSEASGPVETVQTVENVTAAAKRKRLKLWERVDNKSVWNSSLSWIRATYFPGPSGGELWAKLKDARLEAIYDDGLVVMVCAHDDVQLLESRCAKVVARGLAGSIDMALPGEQRSFFAPNEIRVVFAAWAGDA